MFYLLIVTGVKKLGKGIEITSIDSNNFIIKNNNITGSVIKSTKVSFAELLSILAVRKDLAKDLTTKLSDDVEKQLHELTEQKLKACKEIYYKRIVGDASICDIINQFVDRGVREKLNSRPKFKDLEPGEMIITLTGDENYPYMVGGCRSVVCAGIKCVLQYDSMKFTSEEMAMILNHRPEMSKFKKVLPKEVYWAHVLGIPVYGCSPKDWKNFHETDYNKRRNYAKLYRDKILVKAPWLRETIKDVRKVKGEQLY